MTPAAQAADFVAEFGGAAHLLGFQAVAELCHLVLIAPEGGLPRLIAFYSGTWQFGLIVGPAASGFLYAAHPMVPYLVAAVFFTTASLIATTLTLRRPQVRTPSTERATLHHALEGLRFIRSEMAYLLRHQPLQIPSAALRTLAKYAGYKIGSREARLSNAVKQRLSMQPFYWRQRAGTEHA